MQVSDILNLPIFQDIELVAGRGGLNREVFWAHVVDLPDAVDWMRPGDLLLSTGSAWIDDAQWQKEFIRAAYEKDLAGLVVATGRFIDEVPQSMRDAAERWDIPIFASPFRIPFVEVIEGVGRAITQEQAEVLRRSEAIHRALTEAALHAQSLTDLLQVLAGLIGKEAAIENVERKLLARVRPGDESTFPGPRGRTEPVADGANPQKVGIKLPSDWETLSHPVRITAKTEPDVEGCILCPIRVGDEIHGFLWVFEGEDALSDLDIRAAEHGATVAALHLLRHQAVSRVNLTIQSTFLDTLLSGDRESSHLREQAQWLGFNLNKSYALGIAVLLREDRASTFWPLKSAAEYHMRERVGYTIRTWLTHMGQSALITNSMNQVLFPVAVDSPAMMGQMVESLWKRFTNQPGQKVLLAFGSVKYGSEGIRESFREARITASLVSPKARAIRYEDYRLAQLLSLIPGDELAEWSAQSLKAVATSNSPEPFLETLSALVDNGFNQNKTAEALVIHKNTLRYRLRRIEELLGRNINDIMLQHELVMAHLARKVLAATT